MEDDDGFDDFGDLDLAALDDDLLDDDPIDTPQPTPSIPTVVSKPRATFAPFSTSTNKSPASAPTRVNSFASSSSAKTQRTPARTNPPPPAKDFFSQFRNGGKGPNTSVSNSGTAGRPPASSSLLNFRPASNLALNQPLPPPPPTTTAMATTTTVVPMPEDDFEGIEDLDDDWLDEATQDTSIPVGPQMFAHNNRKEPPVHPRVQPQPQVQTKLFPIFGRQQSAPSLSTSNASTTNRPIQPPHNQLTRTSSNITLAGTTSSGSWVPASDKSNDFTSSYFRSPERAPLSSASARPTHHAIDRAAVLTWKYPNNYPKRDYQFNITRRSLFTNTLVSLPTGLGKTFIAAVVMLNYYRWFPESKVIFMAPTRPLVSQQIEACFKICGIPQRDTIELTGQQNSDFREQAWATKRVIFCTPQVLQNDLQSGICPARTIVCLVVDEAHRATGNYAFSEVVRHLTPVNPDFRILALTATPGSDIKTVQQVVTNLNIAAIELRTEDSMDLRPYVFQRVVQEIIVPPGKTLSEIRDEFKGLAKQYLEKLHRFGVIDTPELSSLTRFSVIRGRDFYLRNSGHGQETMNQVRRLSTLCSGLIHAYELLTIHGIRPFFVNLADPAELALVGYLNHGTGSRTADGLGDDDIDLDNIGDPLPTRGRGRGRGGASSGRGRGARGRGRGRASSANDGETSSLAKKTLQSLPAFGRLMNRLVGIQNQPGFIGHPKLERLVGIVVEHFVQHQDRSDSTASRSLSNNSDGSAAPAELVGDDGDGDGGGSEELPQTRIMIFANYRESVEEITRVLDVHRPMIRVSSFVGQSSAKGKKGITQKEQQKLVADFQKGHHNVLVATSIGEEGLDIGDVDLIICYDSHSSPIRMLQRMGRTGRKRKGKICLLLSEGQEEQKYRRSVAQYKNVQKSIANGTYLEYYRQSPRILPPGPYPQVDMVRIEAEPYEDPSAAKATRKRRKLNDGTGASSGTVNSSAFLDDEELARFQRKYLIPKRSIRSITFESASQTLVKRLGKVFDRQSIAKSAFDLSIDRTKATTPGLDPTSLVGHSSTTQAFVQSLWQLSASRSELLMQAVGHSARDEYGTRMMSRMSLESEDEAPTLRKKQPVPRRSRVKQQQQSSSGDPKQVPLDLFCPVIDSTSESDQPLAVTNPSRKGKGRDATTGASVEQRPTARRPSARFTIASDDDEDDFEIMQGLDSVLGLTQSRRRPSVHTTTSKGISPADGHGDDEGLGLSGYKKKSHSSSQLRKRRLVESSDDSEEVLPGIDLEQMSGPDESEYGEQKNKGGVSTREVFDFASNQIHQVCPRGIRGSKTTTSHDTHALTDEPHIPLPGSWYTSNRDEAMSVNVAQGLSTAATRAKPNKASCPLSLRLMILPPVPAANKWYQPTKDVKRVQINRSSDNDDADDVDAPLQLRPPRRNPRHVIRLEEGQSSSGSEEEQSGFEQRSRSGRDSSTFAAPQLRRHQQLKREMNGGNQSAASNGSPGTGVVLSLSGGDDFVDFNDDDLAALLEDMPDQFDD